jgi:hypothetical protein
MHCSIFVLVMNPAEQHSHIQTKLRGKPTDVERREQIQSWSIRKASKSNTFHSLPTHTSFSGTVYTFPLIATPRNGKLREFYPRI